MLSGPNQYETESYGKQDAKKFVRFKQLPPVLQVSLNRYEFDRDKGNTVKINDKFTFTDKLDLTSLLEPAGDIYHLHSILVHRGTQDSGHYYAFIRPELDDRWFEFNDEKINEVTKDYAFG